MWAQEYSRRERFTQHRSDNTVEILSFYQVRLVAFTRGSVIQTAVRLIFRYADALLELRN
jgi:hypothetical protein